MVKDQRVEQGLYFHCLSMGLSNSGLVQTTPEKIENPALFLIYRLGLLSILTREKEKQKKQQQQQQQQRQPKALRKLSQFQPEKF